MWSPGKEQLSPVEVVREPRFTFVTLSHDREVQVGRDRRSSSLFVPVFSIRLGIPTHRRGPVRVSPRTIRRSIHHRRGVEQLESSLRVRDDPKGRSDLFGSSMNSFFWRNYGISTKTYTQARQENEKSHTLTLTRDLDPGYRVKRVTETNHVSHRCRSRRDNLHSTQTHLVLERLGTQRETF